LGDFVFLACHCGYGHAGLRLRWIIRLHKILHTLMRPDGQERPSSTAVQNMSTKQIRMDGRTPEYVGGGTEFTVDNQTGVTSSYETSYWELHCEMQDGAGDGTVPNSSGAAPMARGGNCIQQQFKLTGFGHEPAYHNATAQRATLYAINKITGKAKSLE
jgi:hypothetical protein